MFNFFKQGSLNYIDTIYMYMHHVWSTCICDVHVHVHVHVHVVHHKYSTHDTCTCITCTCTYHVPFQFVHKLQLYQSSLLMVTT